MTLPIPEDFKAAFTRRYSPMFATAIIRIIESSAREAFNFCDQQFKAGNYAMVQGWLRRQYIEDATRVETLPGGVIAEPRDFKGNILDGDERRNNFTLIVSKDVGMIICRVSQSRKLPNKAPIRQFLASLPFDIDPLFPLHILRADLIPENLKILFVVRYWLDPEDSVGKKVSDIDVIVMNHDCRSVFCEIVDLREYAAHESRSEDSIDTLLPMAFLDKNEQITPIFEQNQDIEGILKEIPMKFIGNSNEDSNE